MSRAEKRAKRLHREAIRKPIPHRRKDMESQGSALVLPRQVNVTTNYVDGPLASPIAVMMGTSLNVVGGLDKLTTAALFMAAGISDAAWEADGPGCADKAIARAKLMFDGFARDAAKRALESKDAHVEKQENGRILEAV